MTRIVSVFFAFIVGCISINAQISLPSNITWEKIICNIYPNIIKNKGRSIVYFPQLYYSDEYISIQSEFENYENVHVMITNAQSVVVKDEFINVMTGDENLYYIGDLNSGDYNIMLETDDLILVGNFII